MGWDSFVSMIRGWNHNKAKAALQLSSKRCKVQRNKMLKSIKECERALLDLMNDASREEKLKIKAEQLIQYQRLEMVYDILESVCDLIGTRSLFIDQCTSIPADLVQQIATLVYAESRCEVPELSDVLKQLKSKFGSTEMDLKEGFVLPKMVTLLSISPPSNAEIDDCVADVADRYGRGGGGGGAGGTGGGAGGVGGRSSSSKPAAVILDGFRLPEVPRGFTNKPTFSPSDAQPPPDVDDLAERLKNLKQ